MHLTLRNNESYIEAILDEEANFNRFHHWADFLSEKLKISFIKKLDDFEALYWDFIYNGTSLTLSINIFNGISIFPSLVEKSEQFENLAIAELVNTLNDAMRDK